jgi:hypothetical protein
MVSVAIANNGAAALAGLPLLGEATVGGLHAVERGLVGVLVWLLLRVLLEVRVGGAV